MAARLFCFLYLSVTLLQFGVTRGSDQSLSCSDKTRCSSCDCAAVKKCGGVLRVRDGSIELPQGTNTTCLDCTWVLSVPGRKLVRLTFSQFDLGRGDNVKVFNGPSPSDPLIVKYSEGDSPVDLVSSGNQLTVTFHSDSCGNDAIVSGSFMPIDCGGLFYLFPNSKQKKQQIVQSPNYPRSYPSNSNCLWTFLSGKNTLLSANIKIGHVSTNNLGDEVVLHESLSKSTETRQIFRGLRPVRNRLLRVRNVPGFTIAFSSTKGSTGKGFFMTIVSLLSVSDCTHPLKLVNGAVTFTDFGKTARYTCCNGFKLVGDEKKSCRNGGWPQSPSPSCTPVASCTPPENMEIVEESQVVPLGSHANLGCVRGYTLSNAVDSITALCNCNGQWNISNNPPPCKKHQCGPPPSPPTPNGGREDDETGSVFPVGSIVNYTCPSGYGLDGIPYRFCSDNLAWEPITRFHNCTANFKVCLDPGTPVNGFRRVFSFGIGQLASFGCKRGYVSKGSQFLTCETSDDGNARWTGERITCTSKFKTSGELADQLKQSFVDRTFACIGGSNGPTLVTPTYTSTPTSIGSLNGNNDLPKAIDCRGRTVVVGEGCIDLIYIVDCSKSVGLENFNQSLDFAGRSASLFDIAGGVARVTLITYDDNVYQHFKLGDKKTRADTVKAIRDARFCAGATATRKVLQFLIKNVINKTRTDCRRAVFLFSDGHNNWAGDPENEAKRLKGEKNLEIYTMAFGNPEKSINVKTLQSLASRPDYFFEVRYASKIRQALNDAFHRDIDYCKECGTTLTPECRNKTNGECESEKGAWPWVVGIYRLIRGNPIFHCGGTIIGDCWVLTAAHCLVYEDYRPQDIRVVIGDSERFVREYSEETYFVEKSLIHPEYNVSGTFNRDIALLKLSCNATCSPRIRKACLPKSEDKIYYRPGTNCIVAGWGSSEALKPGQVSGQKVTKMKQLHLPIADKAQCIASTSLHFRNDVTDFTVCAGDGNGQNDPCHGDSGGPLFCKRRDKDTYVLVGIVSWGEGCGQPNKYGIFTHLLNLMDWVHDQMATYKCEPSLDPKTEEQEQCERPPRQLV